MGKCIEVKNLSKSFHGRMVVDCINFTVEEGGICAFLGPNGAGKSTTMNLLAMLLKPTSGQIMFEQDRMNCSREQIKKKVGFVFQEDTLDQELTVYQNLYYRGGLYLRSRKEIKERIAWVVELLGIEGLLRKKYGNCSGGQRRIVQIGRALLSQPCLLILDEPTVGLDPLARNHVWEVLVRLNQENGQTIFFSTHYLEETKYATQICMINEGKLLFHDRVSQKIQKKDGTIVGGSNLPVTKEGHSVEEVYLSLLRGCMV